MEGLDEVYEGWLDFIIRKGSKVAYVEYSRPGLYEADGSFSEKPDEDEMQELYKAYARMWAE